ncbi:hypothetical protein BAOM_2350 [Peribacillus asahii]|uniref:Uncharacterized protein n=1 Tax=Peribacillus asahii TaxID=228899 RepID=A0A3Q9RME0_9BACI|nr:hypothetical protein BAOM_2350 [Peribacillus asahii]
MLPVILLVCLALWLVLVSPNFLAARFLISCILIGVLALLIYITPLFNDM